MINKNSQIHKKKEEKIKISNLKVKKKIYFKKLSIFTIFLKSNIFIKFEENIIYFILIFKIL
jgi:uncharacterized phage-associated protein